MQQLYEVELTDTAERTYFQLYTTAQARFEVGQDKHPSVAAFNAVQTAIGVILPCNPCDSGVALMGKLSPLYSMPLGSVSISYVVNSGKQSVLVLTISDTERNCSARKWLSAAFDNGDMDELLESLGIEKPHLKLEVNSRWLH